MNFKHYRWDSRNQLRAVDTPSGETWFYRYDPFGRRVSKRCAERGEEVRYLWDGDQIAEVRHYRQGQQTSRRHRVYNCWELVVQQRHTAAGGWETDFVSIAQNGEPQALYDSKGELRWQAPKATLWGHRAVAKTESADPGLAFAGQLRDSESGLCYSRFRYYDPVGGGYISPDPIGLAGGLNLYQYAPNPLTWIDPLGLGNELVTYWPPNDGAYGEIKISMLEPGSLIDRYGHPGGTYTSPVGTPYSMCALPPGTNNRYYTIYEVLKPMPNIQESKIAPWFGEIGMGTQYKLDRSVQSYIDSGHLKEIKKIKGKSCG